jgi:hypothetical protein
MTDINVIVNDVSYSFSGVVTFASLVKQLRERCNVGQGDVVLCDEKSKGKRSIGWWLVRLLVRVELLGSLANAENLRDVTNIAQRHPERFVFRVCTRLLCAGASVVRADGRN